MNVLLTAVDLNKSGGVASYYRAVLPLIARDITFVPVGSRSDEDSRILVPLRLLRDFGAVLRLLWKTDYDIVHVNPSLDMKSLLRDGFTLLGARAFKKRCVVYIFGWNPDVESRLERGFLPLFRFVFFKASAIIVQAVHNRDKLIEWGFRGRIYVETGVVDESLVLGMSEDAISARALRPNGRICVLFLARVERKKGIFETVEAFRILKNKGINVRLVIAGGGGELGRVRDYIRREGLEDVECVGHITGERLRDVLHSSDIYTLVTSHGEGMPSSLLESMACGLPVITRPVGGIADFFVSGEMGYYVQGLDAQEIAARIEGLARDRHLRLEIGLHNHRFAQERFLASSVARRIERIYDETSGRL